MRILVTGASGFLGRAILRAGADAGHTMVAASRNGEAVDGASEALATGDLVESAASLDLSGVDAVINCAARVHVLKREDAARAKAQYDAMNAAMPVGLARNAQAAGVRRFIQISSVAAIASASAAGEVLDDASLSAPTTPYGQSKLAADLALAKLAQDGFAVISLRPPAIYGPGVGAWFAMLARAAKAGMPLPVGAIRNLRSFAYVENVANAAVTAAAASEELLQSGSFIVSDSLPISTAQLYSKLLAIAGHRDRVWRWPEALIRPAARLVLGSRAQSLLGNAAFDGSRFAQAFDWQPRWNMDDALRLTLQGD
ncbi:NAD-dependent epimerase/dehydratase family protein [uncultured Erythrobacter sp.]|uniref:NAD-dependent epimerase/dehydratase family protein n=1 Tax=uncultured Erythrobacter sp. TaxID=263913 RepID=UPI0026289BF4|nr:NAD-dependent epimerase/dehydratase family protein [uncultured Erythrobacter sp.]